MQGKKKYALQLFYELSLERLVPEDNFYRQIEQNLDLHFLYKATKDYYGTEGQQRLSKENLPKQRVCVWQMSVERAMLRQSYQV